MAGPGPSSMSQARWELENAVQTVQDSDVDAVYHWNPAEQREMQQARPWLQDPTYFKRVRISALALLKMAMHARSGGDLEVMGVMQGKVLGDTFVVMDAFPLPVEGTETRVNAQAEAYEYMVEFLETNKASGREENIVGWYHSHPGYGCWLSGIDVGTQLTNQKYQEPFLAVVVDPHRTEAAGKVELGAFRTYPEGYKAPDAGPSEYQTIPMEKIEDFGVHANQYYPLDVTFFKSSLDAQLLGTLWNSYWVKTLCASPLLQNQALVTGQLQDVAKKLSAADKSLWRPGTQRSGLPQPPALGNTKLEHVVQDAVRLASEQIKGLSNQVCKQMLCQSQQAPASSAQAMEA
ncbi:hypothetical protein ACKKBG_A30665 [Auxenochlorella protothecoides x Auxenochlorella symbiontica]